MNIDKQELLFNPNINLIYSFSKKWTNQNILNRIFEDPEFLFYNESSIVIFNKKEKKNYLIISIMYNDKDDSYYIISLPELMDRDWFYCVKNKTKKVDWFNMNIKHNFWELKI